MGNFIEAVVLISGKGHLRDYRNKLIHHRNIETLPPVKELYKLFREANQSLTPMGMYSPSANDRFGARGWTSEGDFGFLIDEVEFNLKVEDIRNLILQLDSHTRGQVNYNHGLLVVAKYHDYYYEILTVYIEGYQPFCLDSDEVLYLQDFLQSVLGHRLYG